MKKENDYAKRALSGRQASVDGFAHEHIAAGILMKKYQKEFLLQEEREVALTENINPM